MNPHATRQAIRVAVALGVGVLLIGSVYYLAEQRAESRMRALISMQSMAAPFEREPVEARGVEGFLGPEGFLVTSLDGRARELGLRVGDTVVSSAGQRLFDPFQIVPGARMEVIRGGRTIAVTSERKMWRPTLDEERTIDVRGLDGQVTSDGLWINSVEGSARRWGLRRGDLVRAINGQPLHVRRDAVFLIRSIDPRTRITFEIVRDGALVLLPHDPAGGSGTAMMPGGPRPNDPAMAIGGR